MSERGRAKTAAGATCLLRRLLVAALLVIISSGCSVLPSRREPPAYQHRVRFRGETLTYIARWYTGSAANWRAIAAANPGIEPRRMQLGDKIAIPRSMLRQSAPMPKTMLASRAAPKIRLAETHDWGSAADTWRIGPEEELPPLDPALHELDLDVW